MWFRYLFDDFSSSITIKIKITDKNYRSILNTLQYDKIIVLLDICALARHNFKNEMRHATENSKEEPGSAFRASKGSRPANQEVIDAERTVPFPRQTIKATRPLIGCTHATSSWWGSWLQTMDNVILLFLLTSLGPS